MALSFKGAISFGLIYIPISLHTVIKNNDLKFHLLDKKTNSRVKYKKTCVDCNNKEVSNEDIVKAFEYEDGKYITFSNEDFEDLKTKKEKNIVIESFVKLEEIDPIYYDKAYYVIPNSDASKPFNLLKEAMKIENKVGIAKTVIGTSEKLIALRVVGDIMYLYTLYFHEDIANIPYVIESTKIEKQELDLATTLINTMTKKFNPKDYKDEYKQKVLDAIKAKIMGKEFKVEKEEKENQALDLLVALEESIKNYGVETRS